MGENSMPNNQNQEIQWKNLTYEFQYENQIVTQFPVSVKIIPINNVQYALDKLNKFLITKLKNSKIRTLEVVCVANDACYLQHMQNDKKIARTEWPDKLNKISHGQIINPDTIAVRKLEHRSINFISMRPFSNTTQPTILQQSTFNHISMHPVIDLVNADHSTQQQPEALQNMISSTSASNYLNNSPSILNEEIITDSSRKRKSDILEDTELFNETSDKTANEIIVLNIENGLAILGAEITKDLVDTLSDIVRKFHSSGLEFEIKIDSNIITLNRTGGTRELNDNDVNYLKVALSSSLFSQNTDSADLRKPAANDDISAYPPPSPFNFFKNNLDVELTEFEKLLDLPFSTEELVEPEDFLNPFLNMK